MTLTRKATLSAILGLVSAVNQVNNARWGNVKTTHMDLRHAMLNVTSRLLVPVGNKSVILFGRSLIICFRYFIVLNF